MNAFTEDDLLPISGLQHLAYCPRQFALIHLEQSWEENRFTAEGRVMHRRVHEEGQESRGDLQIARGLRLHSLLHGLSGVADAVEFHRAEDGLALPGKGGRWRPFPVEYKRGRPKQGGMDEVQLCAQALCLEEMLGIAIPAGALFYGQTRRRKEVPLTPALRGRTADLAAEMHRIWVAGRTPPAEYGPRCEQCSLLPRCLPNTPGGDRTRAYIETIFREER